MPKSRVLAPGLLMAHLVTGAVPEAPTTWRPLTAEEAAGGAGRRHPGAWTRSRRSGAAEQRLQAANSRLGYVRDDLAAARRALSGHVSSYMGGTRPLSGILGSSADVVVSRVEFETILQEGQVEAVADAKVAFDSYEAAIKDVKAAMAQMAWPRPGPRRRWPSWSRDFEKAKQVADKLAGFNTTHLVNGRFVSCPVSKPYSFVDFGAPPGGRGPATRGPTS